MDTINTDLRKNIATWQVPINQLPAVASFMHDVLPNEDYDPHFRGQDLKTTYFDTQKLELRKNRLLHDKYITLRVRQYGLTKPSYALSAKTEETKFRIELDPLIAQAMLEANDATPILAEVLPADLYARVIDVAHEQPVFECVHIHCVRYAVENAIDRYTLDTAIYSSTDKRLPSAILEYKSTDNTEPHQALNALHIYPVKLSKFLWATEI